MWQVTVINKDYEIVLSFKIANLMRIAELDMYMRSKRIYAPVIKTIKIENLDE